jgi:midasin
LNLAPSEVLEALNRLLDDNRELHIVETQKVIKAHPSFRIFATQNPTEGYGGRKELSEAFKNRFVMIKVRDVPTEELK